MSKETGSRGGSYERHVKAGEQSHKNTTDASKGEAARSKATETKPPRGGTHEQQVQAGGQSRKNSS